MARSVLKGHPRNPNANTLIHSRSLASLFVAMTFAISIQPASARRRAACGAGPASIDEGSYSRLSPVEEELCRVGAGGAHSYPRRQRRSYRRDGRNLGRREFDAAAVAAAHELTFAPAVRGGKPIAARIPFTFEFAYEKPAPAIAYWVDLVGETGEPVQLAEPEVTVLDAEVPWKQRPPTLAGLFDSTASRRSISHRGCARGSRSVCLGRRGHSWEPLEVTYRPRAEATET